MRKRNLSVCISAIMLFSLCIVACGKKEDNLVTISVIHAWGGTETDHVAMRNIYEDFQKENPDIKLQLISMPTRDKMLQKVEDMITVGKMPDIVGFGGMGANRTYDFMLEKNMALDLMPYIQNDQELMNCVSDANLEYWTTENNQIFSISDVLSLSGGYWYNKDILDQAGINELPKTWDEFFNMCENISNWSKIQNDNIKPLQVSAEGYLYFVDHMLADNDGESQIEIEKHQITMIPDEFGETINQLVNVYDYSKSESANYSYRDETSLFNNGELAIYINGVWGAPMIDDKINAHYALLPTYTGDSMSCESACLGYVLGNSGNQEKQDASVRFLKYMMSNDVQTEVLKQTEQIPSNPQIDLSKFKDEKPRLYQAANLVLGAERKIDVPDNLWTASKKSEFTSNILNVFSGAITKEELEDKLK